MKKFFSMLVIAAMSTMMITASVSAATVNKVDLGNGVCGVVVVGTVGGNAGDCDTLPDFDWESIFPGQCGDSSCDDSEVIIPEQGGDTSCDDSEVTPPTEDNPPATGDDTTPPATGDMTMVFALVALVAMAGAVVVTKKVR